MQIKGAGIFVAKVSLCGDAGNRSQIISSPSLRNFCDPSSRLAMLGSHCFAVRFPSIYASRNKNSSDVSEHFYFCGDAGNRTRVRLISRYVSTMRVSPYIVGREVNEPNPTISLSVSSLAPITVAWSDPSYITPQFNRKEELSETAFRTRA